MEALTQTHKVRKPSWIKAKIPGGDNYKKLKSLLKESNLHTVCEEAKCPNIGECWGAGTLTFMILGDTCTRSCGFCHIKTGKGPELDWEEPKRVAKAIEQLIFNNANITHLVINSVNRDDKNLESAQIFGETISQVRQLNPNVKIEVLIPDFKGETKGKFAWPLYSSNSGERRLWTPRSIFFTVRFWPMTESRGFSTRPT